MMFVDENVAPQIAKATKAKNPANSKGQKTIEQTYTKKTQLEHILLRPDTYVGSVERQTQQMWVLDPQTKQVVNRTCTFVPGLYKIFDEIIVNASDNKQRDPSMNKIEVTIDPSQNSIRVWNNGTGIPVVLHQEHQIYVPELIFGNLLTGSNFDDDEEKTTGGRNGYGAKLANIFSTRFIVETADCSRKLKFKQTFLNNMGSKSTPEVTSFSGTDYTCITFYPDLARFKMDCLDDDIVALLSKRVYDIAGTNTAHGKLTVILNGARIEAKNFEQYIGLYAGIETPCAFERVNERWEIGVGVSDGTFQQVSFVNSICTMKGGCHVSYIADQITAKLVNVIKKRNKGAEVKAHQIKNHLAIYVNALIVNPAFDSQTKENLTTKTTAFGSTCAVSEKMMKQVEKSSLIDSVLSWAKFKQNAELKRKGGSKRSKLVGITKLDDANCAGTSRSHECTLILTEGDSAKALAISGLGVVGRDFYGVFPLKGKLLNVREASHAQIMKNEEIQNIAKILGLTFGKTYEDTSSLRYGHLMIMTDQDHDGSHIKGLLINFLHHFWPSLLRIEGFLQQFITPIVKCSKGQREQTFFTIPQYNEWKEANGDGRGWKIKYYKGLGTSTAAEAKEYFSHLGTHQIDFTWDEKADDMVDMAFAKKRVDDRKLWLLNLEPGMHIDYDVEKITYNDFVNKELILFSHADNERSIPHFMDGLKPSQRKVLFSCFKRNLRQEIKVAQLAGYISEHSAYHHGEASLTQTIIGMAQNYVGSNNINLLSPCGQFGTRLMGGKDAASPRYVFTKLEPITRCIFHPHDDPLLTYLDDDGQSIEPFCYVPVIPMALVNGSEGIGTGWSTSIPNYNPREIIANLRLMIAGQPPEEMSPWYRGFAGEIQAKAGKDANNFSVTGTLELVDDSTVVISELPVGKWTNDYKQFLESSLIGAIPAAKEDGAAPQPAFVKDFKENHTDTSVLFTVTVPPEKLAEAEAEKGGLYKKFKLESSVATSNMHMFDMHSMMHKFESAADILVRFYDIRVDFYDKRKNHLIGRLTEDWEKLDNKVRFILAVIRGELVVSNRKKIELLGDLKKKGFKSFIEKKGPAKDGDLDEEETMDDLDRGYDYLLSMKIWSLTQERVIALTAQRDAKRAELDTLLGKTPEDLWLEDLDALELALDAFEAEIEEAKRLEIVARKKARGDRANAGKGKTSARAKPKGKAAAKSYDDDDEMDFDDDDSDFEEKKPKAKPRKPAALAITAAKPAASGGASKAPTAKPPAASAAVPPQRKPLADKPLTSSAATQPKAAVANTAKVVTASGLAAQRASALQTFDLVSDDDEPVALSLMQRLALKKAATSTAEPATAVASAAPAPAPKAAAAKPAKLSKAVASKSSAPITNFFSAATATDIADEATGASASEAAAAAPAASSRPARAAAATKKTYVLDSASDDDEDDFHSDVSDELPVQVSKPKAPAPKAAAVKSSATVSASMLSPIKPAKGGVKRGTKSSTSVLAQRDVFSPGGGDSPMLKKKAFGGSKPAAKPSTKAAAAKKSAAVSKPRATNRRINSDDDDEDAFGADVAPVKARTPKVTRERKPTNYASFLLDDDEDDEDGGDDESDFSD